MNMNDKLLATTPSEKIAGRPILGWPFATHALVFGMVLWNLALFMVTITFADARQFNSQVYRRLCLAVAFSNICGLLTMLCAAILLKSQPRWSGGVVVCGVLFSFLWYITVLLEWGIIDDGEV